MYIDLIPFRVSPARATAPAAASSQLWLDSAITSITLSIFAMAGSLDSGGSMKPGASTGAIVRSRSGIGCALAYIGAKRYLHSGCLYASVQKGSYLTDTRLTLRPCKARTPCPEDLARGRITCSPP